MHKKFSEKLYFSCDENEKKNFPQSHCLLALSIIGNSNIDGEKFAATIDKINRTFKECTILLGDSLHRHTYKIFDDGASSEELYYKKAVQLGDEWIAKNHSVVDQMTIPHKIIRWDQWLNHPNFKAIKRQMDELYEKKPNFRYAIFQGAHEYLMRLDKKYRPVVCTNAFRCSADYSREECAVMQLLANEDFNYVLYAGREPEAIKVIYQDFIKPFYQNRMYWVRYKLQSRKSREVIKTIENVA